MRNAAIRLFCKARCLFNQLWHYREVDVGKTECFFTRGASIIRPGDGTVAVGETAVTILACWFWGCSHGEVLVDDKFDRFWDLGDESFASPVTSSNRLLPALADGVLVGVFWKLAATVALFSGSTRNRALRAAITNEIVGVLEGLVENRDCFTRLLHPSCLKPELLPFELSATYLPLLTGSGLGQLLYLSSRCRRWPLRQLLSHQYLDLTQGV